MVQFFLCSPAVFVLLSFYGVAFAKNFASVSRQLARKHKSPIPVPEKHSVFDRIAQ
jgi:hypothetical protein